MNSYDRENLSFGVRLFFLVLAGVIVMSAVAFAWFWIFSPLQVQRETYSSHQSYGYTTTQQNNLINLMADYQKHQQEIDTLSQDGRDESAVINDLRAEQQADVNRMKNDIQLMDQTQVPTPVTQFLVGK